MYKPIEEVIAGNSLRVLDPTIIPPIGAVVSFKKTSISLILSNNEYIQTSSGLVVGYSCTEYLTKPMVIIKVAVMTCGTYGSLRQVSEVIWSEDVAEDCTIVALTIDSPPMDQWLHIKDVYILSSQGRLQKLDL